MMNFLQKLIRIEKLLDQCFRSYELDKERSSLKKFKDEQNNSTIILIGAFFIEKKGT